MIEIQYQEWCTWITHTTVNDANSLPYYMQVVKESRPDSRIRAIDSSGRIVDSLG